MMDDIDIKTVKVIELELNPAWSQTVTLVQITLATSPIVAELGHDDKSIVIAVEHKTACPSNHHPSVRDRFDRCTCDIVRLHIGVMNDAARAALDEVGAFMKSDPVNPDMN